MRHLFILFAIVFVYFMPDITLQTYGSPWFAYHAIWSYCLVKLISADKSRYIGLIIPIEIIATTITLIACIQDGMSLKTASILTSYSHIMTLLFLAEVAIMGVVMLNVGSSMGSSSVCKFDSISDSDRTNYFGSNLHLCEMAICKTL